jgi:uncharacterized protein YecT (DUF1311 family)
MTGQHDALTGRDPGQQGREVCLGLLACLWQQRNRGDGTLQRLLGSVELREQWRASRLRVCERAAAKAEEGSIHPIVRLSCENALNTALIDQRRKPLLGP